MKIFRKIRQELSAQNKLSKYLRYAIGEIALVVIGILIALQINTWNEGRKERIVERQILTNIKAALESDIKNQIRPNLEDCSKDLQNIERIMQSIDNKDAFNDSTATIYSSLMFSKNFKYELTAYKALENEGIKVIRKPELKKEILEIYNMDYPEVQEYIQNFSNNLIEFFRPYMREHFKFVYVDNRTASYIPIDYNSIINDPLFRNNVMTAKVNFSNILSALEKIELNVNEAIKQIEAELENN
jgi:hypothetical protein